MRRFLDRLGPNDSILSLNYDIIVDNALVSRSERIDYGVSVRYALERYTTPKPYESQERPRRNRLRNRRPSPNHPLHKLHGSLNWLYCPSCQHLDVTIGRKGVSYLYEEGSDFTCPVCFGPYVPLIITPTLLKTYDNILLREIWRQAEDNVSKADEVVFIGYSMPDADVQLRCMLKRALYTNRIRPKTGGGTSNCIIRVVDNSPSQSNTHTRYIKLFGDVDYHPDGLKGYVEHLER